MNLKDSLLNLRRQAGFTMIELLIVIAILGILAVAVLSAINPVEQINRGRDTGTQSDAEQLLGGIDRYNAFKGHFPWQIGAGTTGLAVTDTAGTGPKKWDSETAFTDGTCNVSDKLSDGNTAGTCIGAEEMKISFFNRIFDTTDYNSLYIYNRGTAGDSTYVCFIPVSGAFKTEANDRCGDKTGVSLPDDLKPIAGTVCAGAGTGTGESMVCLP